MFKEMLNDIVKWKSLKKLSEYKGESEYYYMALQIKKSMIIQFR